MWGSNAGTHPRMLTWVHTHVHTWDLPTYMHICWYAYVHNYVTLCNCCNLEQVAREDRWRFRRRDTRIRCNVARQTVQKQLRPWKSYMKQMNIAKIFTTQYKYLSSHSVTLSILEIEYSKPAILRFQYKMIRPITPSVTMCFRKFSSTSPDVCYPLHSYWFSQFVYCLISQPLNAGLYEDEVLFVFYDFTCFHISSFKLYE
jgi:hypothetical protein